MICTNVDESINAFSDGDALVSDASFADAWRAECFS